MQVILTKEKKFNIHNLTDLNKVIQESYKYAKKNWEVTVPICNQEDPDAYFRLSYDNWDMFVYVSIDEWVWTLQKMTEWQLSEILSNNVLQYDN